MKSYQQLNNRSNFASTLFQRNDNLIGILTNNFLKIENEMNQFHQKKKFIKILDDS